MRALTSTATILFFIAIWSAWDGQEGTAALTRRVRPAPIFTQGSACMIDMNLTRAVHKLSATRFNERTNAERLLFNSARRSAECRKRVIRAVIDTMNTADDDFTRDTASFDLWRHGSNLLADLKATEALDLLITHFQVKGKPQISFNHNAMMRAVIRMGPIAIPKLNENLRHTSEAYLRRDIVFCITFIGGTAARKVLADALSSEPDRCVKLFMEASLRTLSNKTHPNHIAPSDRLKWYAVSISCPSE